MKKILFIALAGSMMMVSCKRKGCTDPLADNYSATAEKDNGTCKYITNPWAPNNPNNPNPGGGDPNNPNNPGTNNTIEWTSNITTPTTVPANTLVKICQDISVSSSLILQEGVILEFCSGKGMVVTENGSITANGTAAKNVLLKGKVNTAGYWDGLAILSNNPDNVLNHTRVMNGGLSSYYYNTNIYLAANTQLTLSNSTVSGSTGHGLQANSTARLINFSNNKFEDNGKEGLSITFNHLGSLDQVSNYNVNNAKPNIDVRAGTTTVGMTVKNLNTPYLVTGSAAINGHVDIEAGTHFLFSANAGLEVGSNGSLTAVGTSSEKIVLEGTSSAPGFWKGVEIHSNNPQNIFKYVVVKDGGSSGYYYNVGLYIKGSLSLDNSSINNSNSWGVYLAGGSIIKTNGSAQTTVAGVTANNDLSGNGVGGNSNCIDGCMVRFP